MPDLTTIKWGEKDLSYVGRNGPGKCHGIEIITTSDHISLFPVNSRDYSSNCMISVPKSHVGELCVALQIDLLDLVLEHLRDQLPRLLGLNTELDQYISKKFSERKKK